MATVGKPTVHTYPPILPRPRGNGRPQTIESSPREYHRLSVIYLRDRSLLRAKYEEASMVSMTYLLTLLLSGFGLLAAAPGMQTSPPGLHYAWRSLAGSTPQCLAQAEQALLAQAIDPIQTDDASIGGRSDRVSTLLVCKEEADSTIVMIIVASTDDDQALALRDALKQEF